MYLMRKDFDLLQAGIGATFMGSKDGRKENLPFDESNGGSSGGRLSSYREEDEQWRQLIIGLQGYLPLSRSSAQQQQQLVITNNPPPTAPPAPAPAPVPDFPESLWNNNINEIDESTFSLGQNINLSAVAGGPGGIGTTPPNFSTNQQQQQQNLGMTSLDGRFNISCLPAVGGSTSTDDYSLSYLLSTWVNYLLSKQRNQSAAAEGGGLIMNNNNSNINPPVVHEAATAAGGSTSGGGLNLIVAQNISPAAAAAIPTPIPADQTQRAHEKRPLLLPQPPPPSPPPPPLILTRYTS